MADSKINIYFGSPGCGKTTHAAYIVRKCKRRKIPVFSNVPIKGAYLYNPQVDLGVYDISDCVVIIDEASIEFNSRYYKDMSKGIIYFLKMFRHFHIRAIYVYSQAADDMDITLRRLCKNYYMIKKIGYWSFIHRIKIKEDVVDGQLVSIYKYAIGLPKVIFRPLYYRMFDSWSRIELPKKQFELCGE